MKDEKYFFSSLPFGLWPASQKALFRRRFLVVLSFFLLLEAGISNSLAAIKREDTIANQRSRLNDLQEQLDSAKVQIDFLDLKVRDTRTSIKLLEEKIAKQRTKVRTIQEDLQEFSLESINVRSEVERLSKEISEGQAKLNSILQRFRNRLIHLHKIRQGTLLTNILSAKDLNTFLSRYQMVRYLLMRDDKTMDELKKTREKLQSDIAKEKEKQNRLNELSKIGQKNQGELIIQNRNLTALLQTLLLETEVFINRQKRLKKNQDELESQISRIESVRIKDPVEFDRQIEDRRSSQALPASISKNLAVSRPIEPNALGRFDWPLKMVHDLKFLQTGIPAPTSVELTIPYDEEIKAAARGKVLFKGSMGGFGKVIILNHKNAFSSVYGNLDEIEVGLGQVVEKGETIGRIFGGNNTTLHFEIRFGGKAQELLTLLPPLSKYIRRD